MPILSYEILSWSCQLNSRYQVNSVNPQRHVFLLPFSLSHWRYFSLTRISYWPISSVSVSACSALQTAIIVGFSYFLSVFLDRCEAANVKEGKIFLSSWIQSEQRRKFLGMNFCETAGETDLSRHFGEPDSLVSYMKVLKRILTNCILEQEIKMLVVSNASSVQKLKSTLQH